MKTTKSDFKLFCSECVKWLMTLGIKDYEVDFIHENLDGNLAQAEFNTQGRWAKLSLAKDWGKTAKNRYEVRKSAFHEVLELLLADLRTCGNSNNMEKDDVDREIHRVIRVMENVFFE